MLSPDIISKIKKIHIKSGRTVDAVMAGHYRSVFKGVGMEFEEVREYMPGDDVRNIDWKVSARLNRPFIKRYREEREMVVMLLIDMSASGSFGTTRRLKIETAAEIAAILAFNAIRNSDKVGAIFFTDHVESYIPPKKGAGHIWRMIREIFTFKPAHSGTNLSAALKFLNQVSKKKSVVFLISDYLDTDFERALQVSSKTHDVVAVRLSDPGEGQLPKKGIVHLKDAESGKSLIIDASHAASRQQYADYFNKKLGSLNEVCTRAKVDLLSISTQEEAADALVSFFRMREKRTRRHGGFRA